MSLEQFDREMWSCVPEQYAKILKHRIRSYVLKYGPTGSYSQGASYSFVNAVVQFPELSAQYDVIKSKESKYSDRESFWDMKSMAYRALRLRSDVSEERIIEEFRQSDLFFNRRYMKFTEGRGGTEQSFRAG